MPYYYRDLEPKEPACVQARKNQACNILFKYLEELYEDYEI